MFQALQALLAGMETSIGDEISHYEGVVSFLMNAISPTHHPKLDEPLVVTFSVREFHNRQVE